MTTIKYEPTMIYNILGSGFGNNPILYIGNNRITTFIYNDNVNITFRFPSLGGGNYVMRVENPSVGYAL